MLADTHISSLGYLSTNMPKISKLASDSHWQIFFFFRFSLLFWNYVKDMKLLIFFLTAVVDESEEWSSQ